MSIVGGIELGGTKIRVARGTADDLIGDSETFPTGQPAESFDRILRFFAAGPSISAIGVGAFGPVMLEPADPDYARLKGTPKPGWTDFDLAATLRPLGVPMTLDTDVNAAGLAEARRGALRGRACGIYLTIGTGIGGALIVNGSPVRGALHPEMGHLPLVRADRDPAPSACPYHANCAEGLASGPAIQRRFGVPLSDLSPDHDGHSLIADYLGQLAANLVLLASPERIVIGGGVARTNGLHQRVHAAMVDRMNGYAVTSTLLHASFVAPPALGDDAGLIGAILLARAGQARFDADNRA